MHELSKNDTNGTIDKLAAIRFRASHRRRFRFFASDKYENARLVSMHFNAQKLFHSKFQSVKFLAKPLLVK